MHEINYTEKAAEYSAQLTQELALDLQCFWTGEYPKGATMDQIILAQWGRKRIDAMSNKD